MELLWIGHWHIRCPRLLLQDPCFGVNPVSVGQPNVSIGFPLEPLSVVFQVPGARVIIVPTRPGFREQRCRLLYLV